MEDIELIKSLTEQYAPTGNEGKIFDLIKKSLSGFVDDFIVHKGSNSLIAFKKGSAKCSLLLEAHVDEVFMIVTDVLEDGFLKVYSRSIDPKILLGSKVVVHGKRELTGIIGIKPYHLVKVGEEHKPYNYDSIYVDCGIPYKELKEIVSVGDYVTFKPSFEKLNGYYINKSLDNRLGVFTLIGTLKSLKNIRHGVNVYALFSSQEEFTSLGAITSAFSIFPDAAIAVDVTFATQDRVSDDVGFDLGKGPTIFMGVSTNRRLSEKLIAVAEKFGIPYQKEVGVLSSTNADKIELVRSGIPTALLSIPIRYMHTPIEMFDPIDVHRSVQLLKLFIEQYEPIVGGENGEY